MSCFSATFPPKSSLALQSSNSLPIWEKLNEVVRHHRKFPDANWAFPGEIIKKIEEISNLLVSSAPELKYHYLFGDRGFDLFDEKRNYEEQQKRLDEA